MIFKRFRCFTVVSAPASDDELSQRLRSRSETPQRPVHRSQGHGQGQGQTGGSEIDTSSYRHNLLGGGQSRQALRLLVNLAS